MLPARIHRLIASALVAVWIQAAGLPFLIAPHFDADDIACGDDGWRTQGTESQVRAADSRAGDGHCSVCHLQRALRHAFVSAPVANHELGIASNRGPQLQAAPQVAIVQLLSTRAPPSV